MKGVGVGIFILALIFKFCNEFLLRIYKKR